MENLTHSLVGAAMAELALPAGATRARRRVYFALGIIAANLPDADLVYTRITARPLGYLLHHRGHTHTVAGLVAQAALIAALCMLPPIRRAIDGTGMRLLALIGASLLGHLVLDSWNSYGVHPFWPLDNRWFYGDAIFILEPWLWVLLGTAAALNTRDRRRGMVIGALLALLPVVLVVLGMIPVAALGVIALATAALVLVTRHWARQRRSMVALALTGVFVAGMFGIRQRVRSELRETPAAGGGEVVDMVLNPRPANPLCWTALAVTRHEAAGEYRLTPATVAPLWRGGCGASGAQRVTWDVSTHQSLAVLRTLASHDCWTRAWLRFGRVPEVHAGVIGDSRFGGGGSGDFSAMPVRAGAVGSLCPQNLPPWEMPRGDLLIPAAPVPRVRSGHVEG